MCWVRAGHGPPCAPGGPGAGLGVWPRPFCCMGQKTKAENKDIELLYTQCWRDILSHMVNLFSSVLLSCIALTHHGTEIHQQHKHHHWHCSACPFEPRGNKQSQPCNAFFLVFGTAVDFTLHYSTTSPRRPSSQVPHKHSPLLLQKMLQLIMLMLGMVC